MRGRLQRRDLAAGVSLHTARDHDPRSRRKNAVSCGLTQNLGRNGLAGAYLARLMRVSPEQSHMVRYAVAGAAAPEPPSASAGSRKGVYWSWLTVAAPGIGGTCLPAPSSLRRRLLPWNGTNCTTW